MISSMTGYGRAALVLNGRSITVEIRSVNSRYFEYSSRMPKSCNFLDDKLKEKYEKNIINSLKVKKLRNGEGAKGSV